MKSAKNILIVIVFTACVGLGWLFHYHKESGRNLVPTQSMVTNRSVPANPDPPANPQFASETVNKPPIPVRRLPNPSQMAWRSNPVPEFKYNFTLEPVSETILEKTRVLSGISSPQCSPDGSRIVFSAGIEGNHDLWIIDISGKHLARLTDSDADEIDPSWMSDGKRIVYSSNATGSYELRVIDTTGANTLQITSGDGYDKYHPRCSPILWENYAPNPDGTKREPTILYQAVKDGRSGIRVVGEDGAFPSPVTTHTDSGENYYQPEWSPHGLTCIYTRELNGQTTLCQGWDIEGFGVRTRFQELPIPGVQHPVFVPNGTKLTFLDSGRDKRSLGYATVNGSGIGKITLNHEIHDGVGWAPDGSLFVYATAVGGEECLVIQKVYYPLQDVTNLWQYADYSADAIKLLEKSRFVVTAKEHLLFHVLYERYSWYFPHDLYATPLFITVDSTLELFHLFFDYTLRTTEERKLLPLLRDLIDGCVHETGNLNKTGHSPEMKNDIAALGNFFEVAQNLLLESRKSANEAVVQELTFIESSKGISMSPVLETQTDYTQFAVRGHYTRSDELKRYFRAMMWLGKSSFRAEIPDDPEKARQETRRALILTAMLTGKPELLDQWETLYEPLLLFVGGADDFHVRDYRRLMRGIYTQFTIEEFYDDRKLDRFLALVHKEKAPLIAPQDGRSFRFMPQRFTPDSYILQNLVYDAVGTADNPRLLPRGLDIMAVLGSERAYEILDRVLGETRYERYGTQVTNLKEQFVQVSTDEWWQNSYWGWLYTLMGLLPDFPEPYPPFMRNAAWKDKSLSTALASWTELRHDTILYVKESAAEAGEGGEGWMPLIPKPKGYVEPNVDFYRRLKKLITASSNGLKAKNLFPDELSGKTEKFLEIVSRLETIAEKELNRIPLTEDDNNYIMRYGAELEYLTIFLYGESFWQIGEGEVSLIADVATDRLNNRILHEAVGRVREMDVIVPIEGRNQLNKGGVFTYYEFPVDGKRLNDDEWRLMLKEGKAPELPVWTNSYIAR